MNVSIYYLPFVGEDHDSFTDIRFLRADLGMGGDREAVTREEFETYYEKVGEDDVDSLGDTFARWNAGSGFESSSFARRECTDCGAEFTGEQDDGSIDLRVRQKNAEAHEEDYGHEVEASTRSLSVGDIVVDHNTGEVVLCAPMGWTTMDFEVTE